MIWYQLYRPFAFGLIKNRHLRILRVAVPAIVTLCLFMIYWALPVKPPITGDKKYLDYLLQIVGILPGFYIAALAAAATFSNPALDEPMPGHDAPMIDIRRGGETFEVRMTMRVFMCHLFSYLSAMSFVTSVLILGVLQLTPSYDHILGSSTDGGVWRYALQSLGYLSVALCTYFFVMIIVVTLHGLYFLVERMHQENR